MEFEFAKKKCPTCGETKIAVIDFSFKGRQCRDCARANWKKHRDIPLYRNDALKRPFCQDLHTRKNREARQGA